MDYRKFLKEKYAQKLAVNPRYSMRAFARDLGIPPSRLSEILTKKSGLSLERAQKIGVLLKLTTRDFDIFVNLVQRDHGRSRATKEVAQKSLQALMPKAQELSEGQLAALTEITDLSLLEVLKIPGLHHRPEVLATYVGRDTSWVQTSLQRLVQQNLIKKKRDRYVVTSDLRVSSNEVASPALQHLHAQVLKHAQKALIEQTVNDRDLTAYIFNIDIKDLPRMKERIKHFRREMASEFEVSDTKDISPRTYCLSVQLFRMSEELK